MISGLLTPLSACNSTFPPELREELLHAVPDYVTEVPPDQFNLKESQGRTAYAEALLASIRVRGESLTTSDEAKPLGCSDGCFHRVGSTSAQLLDQHKHLVLSGRRGESIFDAILPRAYEEIDTAVEPSWRICQERRRSSWSQITGLVPLRMHFT